MDYIATKKSGESSAENPFTELPNAGDDRKALIVLRGEWNYVVLNRYPYNPGHCMVVPYREAGELDELSPEEHTEFFALLTRMTGVLRRAMNPHGFNIGINLGRAAGAGIPRHLHCHIVPRWEGDTNFLTVIGDSRTLPQALDETWSVLRDHL